MTAFSLNAVGLRHGGDKASLGHNYLSFYESYFAPLRRERLKILEIGVLAGQSLRTWADYFENAEIVGFDIRGKTRAYASERVAIEIGDQSNVQHLVNLGVKHGPFDIVIDDGSHMCEHQITTLRTLFPFVKDTGFYIVEDLQTNFGEMLERFRGVSSITCVEYLKRWQDLLIGALQINIDEVEDAFLRTFGRKVRTIAFHRHVCLIQKNWFEAQLSVLPVLDDATRSAALPVAITAHLRFVGDVTVENGRIHHIQEPLHPGPLDIQGVSLSTGRNWLEYKVCPQNGEWTGWAAEGDYIGSRGQSRALVGVAVRLKPEAVGRYVLRTAALFRPALELLIADDGGELSPGGPLCGLQIDLIERAP